MKTSSSWFDVDRKGLAQLRAETPKSSLLFELLSNAFDTDASDVSVTLTPVTGRDYQLSVTDNSRDGWADVSHSYTLFAPSIRKTDSEKRGRFNLGEKLVLALCKEAVIETMAGTIAFHESGERSFDKSSCTESGTRFTAKLKLVNADVAEIDAAMHKLMVPSGVTLNYNGVTIPCRPILKTIEATLPTVRADSSGALTATKRKCTIDLVLPNANEVAMIYELGIPVVETGDKYHCNVKQKVPLNMNRDNVTPSYLRELRHIIAEATVDLLEAEDATTMWVRSAVEDKEASEELVSASIKLRFGDKVVAYDPSDQESNRRATSAGYTVVAGRSLSSGEWARVKAHELIKPAGRVFPTNLVAGGDSTVIQREDWTPAMESFAEWTKTIAKLLVNLDITVSYVKASGNISATYGSSRVTFNVKVLGKAFFSRGEKQLELIIHELGHIYSGDHLSDSYHAGLCKLGARLATVAIQNPEVFRF